MVWLRFACSGGLEVLEGAALTATSNLGSTDHSINCNRLSSPAPFPLSWVPASFIECFVALSQLSVQTCKAWSVPCLNSAATPSNPSARGRRHGPSPKASRNLQQAAPQPPTFCNAPRGGSIHIGRIVPEPTVFEAVVARGAGVCKSLV